MKVRLQEGQSVPFCSNFSHTQTCKRTHTHTHTHTNMQTHTNLHRLAHKNIKKNGHIHKQIEHYGSFH